MKTFADDTASVVTEIGRHIDEVNPDLSFEMGKASDGVFEIIISANGMQDLFANVVGIAKAAPRIPGWRVIAFRPRKQGAAANSVVFEGMDLEASAMWYRSEPQDDLIAITLCIAGLDEEMAHTMLGPVFLLLDATLGEYDVATRIGAIEFADCPADPAADGFRPITEIASEVDTRFATRAA